jgi:hypothetical protein
VYTRKSVKRPLADRDFLATVIWKAEGDGFVLVSQDTSSPKHPISKGVVRGNYPSAMRISPVNTSETRLEYAIHPDPGGSVPATVFNYFMWRNLVRVTEIQEYFEKRRPLTAWDEKDGRAVGEALLIKTDAESQKVRPSHLSWEEARMRALFVQYRGLKEAGERYEWLEGMLARVLKNRLR